MANQGNVMRAETVLKLYGEGRRDFRGESLRGQSFRGKDLSGADFSGADIRSADFTNAYLVEAKFCGAKAGLQKRWVVVLLAGILVLVSILALLNILGSALIILIFTSSNIKHKTAGFVSLAVFSIFWITFVYKGIRHSIIAVAGAVVFTIALSAILASVRIAAAAAVGVLAGTVAVAGIIAFAVAFAGTVAFAVAGVLAGIIATAFAVAGVLAGTVVIVGIGTMVLVVTFFQTLLSAYVAYLAIKGDEKYALIRNISIAFAVLCGTSFRNVNLTDTDFTDATLKSTDLRKATLTRTRWNNTIKLDRVRPGTSYLNKLQIRELIRTGQGEGINCDRLDLQGVNLQGANLKDASFIGANLNEANLQDTDLTGAKLVHTQLDGVNLTGAILTGACIEDWAITSITKLNGVRCDYVFMRLPPKERPAFIALPPEENNDLNPRRKPDNWDENFKDGDFADFIKPMQQTLDLYHNQQVDPRAVTIAFNQLAENHPEANLSVASLEFRGEDNDKLLFRAKTSKEANHSELSAEYFENYNNLRSLPSDSLIFLIARQDKQIQLLTGQVESAIKSPKIYAENYQNQGDTMTSNPNKFSVTGSVGGDIRNLQGDENRAIQGDDNQSVLGDGNQVTQIQGAATAEEELTKTDVIALIAELAKLIQEAEIPEDAKEETAMYLGAAKKAAEKEEPKKQNVLSNIETATETLEATSKTVDAGKKLWDKAKPIIIKIAGWLGAVAAGSNLLSILGL